MMNGEEGDHGELLYGAGNISAPWADPGTSGRGRGRGRGRARGGRSQRTTGAMGSRSRAKAARGGRKRGRRGVRPKQQKTVNISNDMERDSGRDFLYEESPVAGFQEWNAEETADLRVTEIASSSEYENETEHNGQEYDDEMLVDDGYRNVYDDVAGQGYIGEYGLDGEEEYDDREEDVEDEEDEDEQGGVDVDGFFNDDSDENRDVDGGQIGNNPEEEMELSSSGYSD